MENGNPQLVGYQRMWLFCCGGWRRKVLKMFTTYELIAIGLVHFKYNEISLKGVDTYTLKDQYLH